MRSGAYLPTCPHQGGGARKSMFARNSPAEFFSPADLARRIFFARRFFFARKSLVESSILINFNFTRVKTRVD